MEKGQAGFVVIIVLIIAVVLFVLVAYYFQTSVTGDVVSGEGTKLSVKQNLFDNILTPKNIEMVAVIGKDNKESFEIRNMNDEIIRLGCSFSDFQEFVPSSDCFTFDEDGSFIGSGNSARVLPGQRQSFTVSVIPLDDVKVKGEDSMVRVVISKGEHNRNVILSAWLEDEDRATADELKIPIKIFVGD
ncbi:MAG: hypothetical protein KJ718_06270 [Nanoarchaeota archaeon]|nr:hypothetical protein [Nanoarchaeota archaeon]MBU1988045.1 hypothetical protein [Nanoarchaeota archaeon]